MNKSIKFLLLVYNSADDPDQVKLKKKPKLIATINYHLESVLKNHKNPKGVTSEEIRKMLRRGGGHFKMKK